MSSKLSHFACLVFILFFIAGAALGGVDYTDPEGGWAYIYTGDQAMTDVTAALDGTWDHNDDLDGGSDAWDGSAPGETGSAGAGNAPGGAGVFTEGDTTFLRIQDCGDPRDAGGWAEPSNRKVTFVHDMAQEPGVDGTTILDDGVTISFRARIPTTPPLDYYYPDGGSAIEAWVTRGYNIHDDGYGVFCVKQGSDAEGMISFSLCTPDDEGVSRAGLVMNKMNGTAASADVDSYDAAGTEVLLSGFDPTEWHEFWIQIAADTSGGGTHRVTIWTDGNAKAPDGTFNVTAGTKDEYDLDGYIGMSLGRTGIAGSQDVDFFAYKPGLIPPVAFDPEKARAISPLPGSTVNLPDATPLSWKAGRSAARHDIYLGTGQQDVNEADTTDTSNIYRGRQNLVMYTPAEALELGKTYYWRIDEVEADGVTIHAGNVWSFSILDYILIDDFENYDAGDNQIWFAWHDGLGYGKTGVPPFFAGNGTGAAVGDEDTKSFTEETIVHGGRQSMPYFYDNNKQGFLTYSEATKTLSGARDWTQGGAKALSLWLRGHPAYLGGFTQAPAGTFTMAAEGTDIEGTSDQFHFAWQQLSGAGSITAKVESVQDTDPWAKAGLMIRDTLDANSPYGMVALTGGHGVWFGRRTAAGNATDSDSLAGLTPPYWLKMERSSGGLMRACYSADGSSWTQLGPSIAINMNLPLYIGLAVTSHNPGIACEARFSNVTSDGVGSWTDRDIGLTSNQAAPMYVKIANSNGTAGTVYHDDPNAALISTWTEWNIDLKDFAGQGVDLTDVNSITIGIGDASSSLPGGSGKMYVDDIRLYRPRYVPSEIEPLTADFTGDGIVDYRDLEIMTGDWLKGDMTRPGPLLIHYKFDEGEGSIAADSSGQGSDGTFSGTATWAAQGKMGAAASFDGNVGQVRGTSPYLNGHDEMSFGAWIKSDVVGTDAGVIIFTDPDETDQRDIRYDSAGSVGGGVNVIKYGIATEEGSNENESAANVQTTEWQHVMVTWTSGEAARLYINGVLDTPTSVGDISGGTTTGYTAVIIGRGGKDTAGSWDGLVDDVRVYEVALTAQQVRTVMDGGDVPVVDTYVPLTSPANISDNEPINSKRVNFKDFAALADEWLQQSLWPN
jgi:hypothetical protein